MVHRASIKVSALKIGIIQVNNFGYIRESVINLYSAEKYRSVQ